MTDRSLEHVIGRKTFHRGRWVGLCHCGAGLFLSTDAECYVLGENAAGELVCQACSAKEASERLDAETRVLVAEAQRRQQAEARARARAVQRE